MRAQHLIPYLLTGVHAFHDCPFPSCDSCLAASIHDAPGVGFGLEISYGTAVAYLHNGSVLDVAKVPASPEYIDLMVRLATSSHPRPETFLYRWCRSVNKKLGRPAIPEVEALASMVASLRGATAKAVTNPLDRVVITHPNLPGFSGGDLADALDYAGLRPWLGAEPAEPDNDGGLYPTRLAEASAVFASHGLGLCDNFYDLFECWEEEELT